MKQSLSNVVLDNMGKAATPQGNVSTKWGTVHSSQFTAAAALPGKKKELKSALAARPFSSPARHFFAPKHLTMTFLS